MSTLPLLWMWFGNQRYGLLSENKTPCCPCLRTGPNLTGTFWLPAGPNLTGALCLRTGPNLTGIFCLPAGPNLTGTLRCIAVQTCVQVQLHRIHDLEQIRTTYKLQHPHVGYFRYRRKRKYMCETATDDVHFETLSTWWWQRWCMAVWRRGIMERIYLSM